MATTEFAELARRAAEAQGMLASRIVVVDHPIGGIDDESLARRAEQAVEGMLTLFSGS